MQLQRVLALASVALMGCAFTTSAAWSFADTESSINDEDRTSNEEDRIYGGSEADATKYPFTASLRKTAEGSTYCGGTLIAPQYIVTAAHCVKNTTYVSLGSQYSSGSKDGERLLVTNVWVHPKYVKDTHVFDVAIMKLEKPSTVTPLGLCKADGSQNKENTMAVVRGWGVTETLVPSTTLLEVNVKMISNAVCNKSYNNRITAEMLCAGEGGNKDTCQGDSGGALISSNVLVGIVSWGGACGEAPGVYTRVTSVLDFINEKIGGGSSNSTPAATTAAPAATTATPALTTAAPAAATTAPAATTTAPAATTAAPEATTTTAPAATTTAPAVTTAAPSTPAASSDASDSTDSDATPVTPSTMAPATTKPDVVAPGGSTSKGKDTGKGKGSSGSSSATKKPKKDCGVRL